MIGSRRGWERNTITPVPEPILPTVRSGAMIPTRTANGDRVDM